MEYAQNNSFVGPGHGQPTDDSSIRQKKTGSVPKPNTGVNNVFLPNILEKMLAVIWSYVPDIYGATVFLSAEEHPTSHTSIKGKYHHHISQKACPLVILFIGDTTMCPHMERVAETYTTGMGGMTWVAW